MIKRVGIRREDKNIWERRVPLVPKDIQRLIPETGIELLIQPSKIRIYSESDFQQVGAIVQEDLDDCDLVMGVKEIPEKFFREKGVYMFFSHTVKGQKHNMPMLKALIEKKCTLIEYEKIVDDRGRRLVFFGHFAGLAGMIDTFWTLGKRLKWEGIPNPFEFVCLAHEYTDLDKAKNSIADIGKKLKKSGVPESLRPLVCGFAGYGNVSKGAQEIFDILPHREIEPNEISRIFKRQKPSREIFKVVFKEEHTVKPKNPDSKFDLREFFGKPDLYETAFTQYLDYLTILLNCIYWTPASPRLITKADAKRIWKDGTQPRLRVIGDISCDILGGIEFNLKETRPDNPIYVYNPKKDEIVFGVEGNGPIVMAIDNLPCELPAESSQEFSRALMPFLPDLIKIDPDQDFEHCNLPGPLKKAIILWKGRFTKDYQFMKKFL